jgi:hypothetical protein
MCQEFGDKGLSPALVSSHFFLAPLAPAGGASLVSATRHYSGFCSCSRRAASVAFLCHPVGIPRRGFLCWVMAGIWSVITAPPAAQDRCGRGYHTICSEPHAKRPNSERSAEPQSKGLGALVRVAAIRSTIARIVISGGGEEEHRVRRIGAALGAGRTRSSQE